MRFYWAEQAGGVVAYLLFRILAWPLTGWMTSSRCVDLGMVVKRGRVLAVILEECSWDRGQYYLGFGMPVWLL